MVEEGVARRVTDAVDAMREEIVGLAQTLIRFDSVNQPPGGNEGPCQAFVAKRMAELGLTVDCFEPDSVPCIALHPAYLHGRDYRGRPDAVGTLRGAGGGRSLMMVAHADVVPVGDPAEWTVAPFGAEIKDGKIYGRGAVDDRDGLTGMLAAVAALARAGVRLRGDVVLGSCVDEEFGGSNGLLAMLLKGYKAEAAINCDGIGFIFWVTNTGGGPIRVLLQSKVDTSFPTPAMLRLKEACKEALRELSERWRAEHWRHPLYPPGTPALPRKDPIQVADWQPPAGWDPLTLGPGCGIWAYATTLPGQANERARAEITAAIDAAYRRADCEREVYSPRVEWIYRFMDPSEVPAESPIVQALGTAVRQVSGREPQTAGGMRSDLFMLPVHAGIPAVCFGVGDVLAGPGSAHQPDERIDIDRELIPYVKMLALAIMDWCGYD